MLRFIAVLALFALFVQGCGKGPEAPTLPLEQDPSPTDGVALDPATSAECPTGGTAVIVFSDANQNGTLDAGETILSRRAICNGTSASSSDGEGHGHGRD
jgi:hypothetical protein